MPDPADLSWYRIQPQPSHVSARRLRWTNRRQHTYDALACLSVAVLCFSQARSETLLLGSWDFYSRAPLGAPTLVALLLNILALTAVGVASVQVIRRVQRPTWHRLGAVAATTAVLISLNYARLTHEMIERWTRAIGRPVLLAVIVVLIAIALGWPRPTLRAIRRLALVASPLALLVLGAALLMLIELAGGPVWRTVDPKPIEQTAPSLRRIVWLVFTELDQHITFEARPAGLELPELDRLRRGSLYADAARPPAGTTDLSMPSLITGRAVVAVTPANPHELQLTFADGKTARWSAPPNVFTRVRVLGYDTAVIGWHLPYPRVLGGTLGVADWRPSLGYEQARGDGFGQAFLNQWASLAPPVHARRLYARRVAELGDLALRTANDGRFGLVLLHLPIPQPPGIYDRATGRLTPSNFKGAAGSYLDNLALVDRFLGDLRRSLERTRLDERTWLVVSADQWWRGPRDSGEAVDQRVPFLVRPPGGGLAMHADVPFNTIVTHDLLLAILRGSVSDTRDASTWLARLAVAPPKEYTPTGRPIY